MNEEIRLRIPAQPDMMLVVRMALAGFCSQRGADLDTLEDIRTLSDEACYCLMHQPCAAEALEITAGAREGSATIRFEAMRSATSTCVGEPRDPEIARGILCTLASSVLLTNGEGGTQAIEVAVRLEPL